MKYQINNIFTKNIHFVGIGGAGMSPLAEMLQSQGHHITGSDRARSAASIRLEKLDINIQYDHIPRLMKDADLIVYSSAIRVDNAERVYAKENKILTMRRAEVLGELMRGKFTISISGTHGKTTTTSLIGAIFQDAGIDPTVLVGGMLRSNDSHAVIGNGSVLIAEADEYDRSFLAMFPTLAIITNVEADHLDCYVTLDAVYDAFVEFTKRIPFYGAVIVCNDDPGVCKILPEIRAKVITYGIRNADYTAENIDVKNGITEFTAFHNKVECGTIQLSIPGNHNILNALASIAAACEMGIDFLIIQNSLKNYSGVRRRFEIISRDKGITIIDDYAHHPNEIKATLQAARTCSFSRIIAVFQPHLYSRTRDFMEQFGESLCDADIVFVTDIYKSREEILPGVSSNGIVEHIVKCGHKSVSLISDKRELCESIYSIVKAGDAVIFMGAGDIWECAITMRELVCNG